MQTISWLEILSRLLSSLLLTGIIGLERTTREQRGGLRTHILVGLGSTLITLTSIYGFPNSQNDSPARLAAQIVSGIGFLGAGAILRQGGAIQGLNTAASMWTAAGLGIACGAGFYLAAVITTFLVFFTLEALRRFEESIEKKVSSNYIRIYTDGSGLTLELLRQHLDKFSISLKQMKLTFEKKDNKAIITLSLSQKPSRENLDLLVQDLVKLPGINKVET